MDITPALLLFIIGLYFIFGVNHVYKGNLEQLKGEDRLVGRIPIIKDLTKGNVRDFSDRPLFWKIFLIYAGVLMTLIGGFALLHYILLYFNL